jgi:hypothetical protein
MTLRTRLIIKEDIVGGRLRSDKLVVARYGVSSGSFESIEPPQTFVKMTHRFCSTLRFVRCF